MRTEDLQALGQQVKSAIKLATGAECDGGGYYLATETRRFEVRTQGKSWNNSEAIRVTGNLCGTGLYHSGRNPYFVTKNIADVPAKITKLVSDLDALEKQARASVANAAQAQRDRNCEVGAMLARLHAAGYTATTPYIQRIDIKLSVGEVQLDYSQGWWKVNFSINSGMHNQNGILALCALLSGEKVQQ
jgi:hypothetical protein